MERIGGEVLSDIRDDQEVWVVAAAGHELMTFETFWRALEWRRTNTVYVHHDTATGCQFYVQTDYTWLVLGAATDAWQHVANPSWVENQVNTMNHSVGRSD